MNLGILTLSLFSYSNSLLDESASYGYLPLEGVIHVDEGNAFDLAKWIAEFEVVSIVAFLHLLHGCLNIDEGILHFIIQLFHVFFQELWELRFWQANRSRSEHIIFSG